MRRLFLGLSMLIAASFLTACDPAANSNLANKPANAANNAAPAVNSAALEAEIKKLVNDTAAALAKNDTAALEKLYSDNYMLVNIDGSVQNRADRLASFKSGDTKFDSFTYDEINVRTNPEGTGAVVIARATAAGMNKGVKMDRTVRVTQVWSKTKDGWRQVSGHATQIAGVATSPAANTAASNSNSAASPPTANAANGNK